MIRGLGNSLAFSTGPDASAKSTRVNAAPPERTLCLLTNPLRAFQEDQRAAPVERWTLYRSRSACSVRS
jgi:hypothetical protein